jgi:hypothetical protein
LAQLLFPRHIQQAVPAATCKHLRLCLPLSLRAGDYRRSGALGKLATCWSLCLCRSHSLTILVWLPTADWLHTPEADRALAAFAARGEGGGRPLAKETAFQEDAGAEVGPPAFRR